MMVLNFLFFTIIFATNAIYAGNDHEKLGREIYDVFTSKCASCHGFKGAEKGINVLDYNELILPKRGIVVPGNLEKSKLWQVMAVANSMPPSTVEGADRPSEADIAKIKEWILAGAPPLVAPPQSEPPRNIITERSILLAIHDHLQDVKVEERQFKRYISLANVYNNKSSHVTQKNLLIFRAALVKLCNGLSWERDPFIPEFIDADEGKEILMVLDLRQLGWHRQNIWSRIIEKYPYGLVFDRSEDFALNEIAQKLNALTLTRLPYIRADWFVATASRSPLYEKILQFPETLGELEKKLLGVDYEVEFLTDTLKRGILPVSDVSDNHRVIDRISFRNGSYYRSHDFANAKKLQDVLKFPLGPEFKSNPFPDFAFAPAGGEMIFNLPNGFQAYAISDAAGRLIPDAPENVVEDSKLQPLHNGVVHNAVSCMFCHKSGMNPFKVVSKNGLNIRGDATQKISAIYAEQGQWDNWLAQDSARFNSALALTLAKYLSPDVAPDAFDAGNFAEPIGTVTRQYFQDLDVLDVAAELGTAPEVIEGFARTQIGQELGLNALLEEGRRAIKRVVWEDLLEGDRFSQFHRTASEISRGQPFRLTRLESTGSKKNDATLPFNLSDTVEGVAQQLTAAIDGDSLFVEPPSEDAVRYREEEVVRNALIAALSFHRVRITKTVDGAKYLLGLKIGNQSFDVLQGRRGFEVAIDLSTSRHRVVRSLTHVIDSAALNAAMLGKTGAFVYDARTSLTDPVGVGSQPDRRSIRNGVLFASAGNPYGVQIEVKQADGSFQPTRIRVDRQIPTVDLAPDDVYAIRLVNADKARVAANVYVDGLNVFNFQKQKNRFSKLMINGRNGDVLGRTLMKGWFVDEHSADEFRVGIGHESAAVVAGSSLQQTGVITVIFSTVVEDLPGPVAVRRPVMAPYSDEDPLFKLGTARGESIHQDTKVEPAPRILSPHSIISIRYGVE